jgi:cyclic pyranopterin phosphate synthase
MKSFSHLDSLGQARMVDVGGKPVQTRIATATGRLTCQPATLDQLRSMALPKGDVLAVARVAGILAAKRTDELIPLCHSLRLDQIEIDFTVGDASIDIRATAKTSAKTGVEMEALTAVSVAALTLYDMLKAVDKAMRIEGVRIIEKIKE